MKDTAIYARLQPITDVVGRLDYISNSDRQECLLAVAGQLDPEYWKRLAADSQQAWRESGGVREKIVLTRDNTTGKKNEEIKQKRACEAREIQLLLPRKVLDMSKDEQVDMLRSLDQMFRDQYGLTCAFGLHLSKTENNVHVHILFSEKLQLIEPEVKYASRNVYLNEWGIRCRGKKEILDGNGKIRKGCRVIPKGDVLSVRYFGDKETMFSDQDWCRLLKRDVADWINLTLKPDKRRVVFDQFGPYLAQVHIGKGAEMKTIKNKREYNSEVKAFNMIVETGIIGKEEAQRIKSWVMLSPNRLSALGGALVGIILEHPESRPFVSETKLKDASDEALRYVLQIATGGKRTKEIPDKEQKEKLRRLYREAEKLRQQAKAADSGFEKSRLTAEARQRSMQIDWLRRQMGLCTDQEYWEKIKKIDDEIASRQRRVMSLRSRVNTMCDIIFWKKQMLKKTEEELYSLPLFFADEAEKREKERLRQKIEEQKKEIEELKEVEKMFRLRYLLACREEKLERKRLREERKQLKAEQKKSKRQEKKKEK